MTKPRFTKYTCSLCCLDDPAMRDHGRPNDRCEFWDDPFNGRPKYCPHTGSPALWKKAHIDKRMTERKLKATI